MNTPTLSRDAVDYGLLFFGGNEENSTHQKMLGLDLGLTGIFILFGPEKSVG